MSRTSLLVMTLACAALAQDFTFQKMLPGSTWCPRVEIDAQKRLEGALGLNTSNIQDRWEPVEASKAIPEDQRKDASCFAFEPMKGAKRTIKDLRGKVVVIGLFAGICEPSVRLLGELSELQAKGPQFGFEVLPIGLDRTTVLAQIIRRNQEQLGKTTLYSPGLGKEGLLNLGPEISALPTVAIVDRRGRVAMRWVGFHPGMLVNALKYFLKEPVQPEAPPPPPPPPPAPSSTEQK